MTSAHVKYIDFMYGHTNPLESTDKATLTMSTPEMQQTIWIYLIKLAWTFSVYSNMSVRTCCVSPDQRLPSMGWRGSHVIIEKIKMAKRQPLRYTDVEHKATTYYKQRTTLQ